MSFFFFFFFFFKGNLSITGIREASLPNTQIIGYVGNLAEMEYAKHSRRRI